MRKEINRDLLNNYNKAVTHEYLETNGLGGWSSSTIINSHTRRYHGLLVAAVKPPIERYAVVSKIEETIVAGDQRIEIGCNNYGNVVHPQGHQYIKSFTRDTYPQWTIDTGNTEIRKKLAMIHNTNTVVITYEVLRCDSEFELELMPLMSYRDYHHLGGKNNNVIKEFSFHDGVFSANPYVGSPEVYISVPGSNFSEGFDWYNRFYYSIEEYRGQDCHEDLFTYGKFTVKLKQGDKLGIIVSTENINNRDAFVLLQQEDKRRETLVENSESEIERMLTLAADQFIVQRENDLKTIIAGYHWFGDWGRDTMISLPGLCLATGRYADAKKILSAFAGAVSMGMLPNRFQDYGGDPEYNNVDGTLWFFIAVYKYMQATGDQKFVLEELLPVLNDIIGWHYKGTRYNIHANSDGLLYSGENGVQLTWMDAKIESWVVTPRTGKAVEINALWYNALMIYSELLSMSGNNSRANNYKSAAANVKKMFNILFWNYDTGCLHDVVEYYYNDETIRPNQLFAISLPFPLIEGEKAKSILSVIKEKLYTPVGLRSLDPNHPSYKGVYSGDQLHRDAAYHQGTVWSWLIGPYIDAVMRTNENGKQEAQFVISEFVYHFDESGIGTISEIFDGDDPHTPRGCIAQAWSVAELLRVVKDYSLAEKPEIGKNGSRKTKQLA